MTTPIQRTTRNRALVGAAAAVAALALVAPPKADASGRQARESGSRIEKACKRVPSVRERVQAKIALLQASASTKGSIAWLEDKASAKGKSSLAQALRAKADARRAALVALNSKLSALDAAAAACAARGANA